MKEEQITTLAEMLVVGFCKCWTMGRVIGSSGVSVKSQDDATALHAAVPFMPNSFWVYHSKFGGAPVRAVVGAEWPSLGKFLDANIGRPEKLLSCVPQIKRLRFRGAARHILSSADQKEGAATMKDARQVAVSNRAARTQQLSTQRGAWHVVKG